MSGEGCNMLKDVKKTTFKGKKMKNPFEFGKFISYFACCLATCPWRVCCTQEGK